MIFTIAGSLGIPICLDEATCKMTFGHFARVLVDIDLKGNLHDRVLVEKVGFAFFLCADYEKLPPFCSYCQYTSHSNAICKKHHNSNHVEFNGRPKERIDSDNRKAAAEKGNEEQFNAVRNHVVKYVPKNKGVLIPNQGIIKDQAGPTLVNKVVQNPSDNVQEDDVIDKQAVVVHIVHGSDAEQGNHEDP